MLKPRWYQDEAANAIYPYLVNSEAKHPLILLPTGTGKSLVIALIIERALKTWPNARVLMLTHDKELVKQNAAKLVDWWPQAPVGIMCAGLRRSDTAQPVIFGTIGSVAGKVELLGPRHIIIIDEAHRVSPNDATQYRKTLDYFLKLVKGTKIIGLSATAFRQKQGMLNEGEDRLFTDIVYNKTSLDEFNEFIKQGFLAPLTPKRTETVIDVSAVKVRAGEYVSKDLDAVSNVDSVTQAACLEMIDKAGDRYAWVVYTSSVDHAEKVAGCLQHFGVDAYALHSKIKQKEQRRLIADFRNGGIRCLVTNNMLTTGFDYPQLDFIGVLRATLSVSLWLQMLGRGTRPHPDKVNCLVLDFAENAKRLGPINDPRIPKRSKKESGDIPVKECSECGILNYAAARFCGGGSSQEDAIAFGGCGEPFTFEIKYQEEASDAPLIRTTEPILETKQVSSVWYNKHVKQGRNPTLKITYVASNETFYEWVAIEGLGKARENALSWWHKRTGEPFPKSVDDALSVTNSLPKPRYIQVNVNTKYPEVVNYAF